MTEILRARAMVTASSWDWLSQLLISCGTSKVSGNLFFSSSHSWSKNSASAGKRDLAFASFYTFFESASPSITSERKLLAKPLRLQAISAVKV